LNNGASIPKHIMVLGIRGGVGVQKKFVKSKLSKENSAKMLHMQYARPVADTPEQDAKAAVDAAKDDIKHIKDAVTANEQNIVRGLLSTCTHDELKVMFDNFPTTGGNTSDKIVGIIGKLSKSYIALDKCAEYIGDTQMKYEQALVNLYIKEYTTYNEDTGDTTFNNKAFKTMLNELVVYKRGEADALAAAGAAAAANRQWCVVM
jgi:hypothetical protein